jgi:hypothetical protein
MGTDPLPGWNFSKKPGKKKGKHQEGQHRQSGHQAPENHSFHDTLNHL